MLPEGLVKVDYEHYFPVFNKHYTDKPTFILMCEFEKGAIEATPTSEGVPGTYCDRSSWWHEFDDNAKVPALSSNYNFVYSDGRNAMHKELMTKMGLTNKDLPTLRAVDPTEPYHHFKYEKPLEEMNFNRLLTFAFGVTSGGSTTIKLTQPLMPLQN